MGHIKYISERMGKPVNCLSLWADVKRNVLVYNKDIKRNTLKKKLPLNVLCLLSFMLVTWFPRFCSEDCKVFFADERHMS